MLVAVCCLLYADSLTHEFLLDDFLVLFGQQGVMNRSLASVFSGIQVNFYRPVGHVILWVCSRIFGEFAPAYHGVNIALFAVICILFFVLIRRFTGNENLAFLTAVLYCVHPINSMLVHYVTANVISTFVISLQLSFLLYLSHTDRNRVADYWTSLLFFVLALFSHEMAGVYPLFLVCFLYFIKEYPAKKILSSTWPFFTALLVYILWRWHFFSLKYIVAGTGQAVIAPGIYLASLADLLVWYVSKLIFPKDIIFLWTADLARFYILPTILGILGIGALGLWLIFLRWKRGVKPFALTVFAVGLLPISLASFTYFPTVKPLIEPHWFYFTSIGFFLLVAWYLLKWRNRLNPAVWLAILLIIVGLNTSLLSNQNRTWTDQETYCRYWLSLNPHNLTPYHGLGKSLMDRGEFDQAVAIFREGIQATTIYNARILADMGYAELMRGRPADAMHYFKQVQAMDPGYAQLYYYMAHYHQRRGQARLARAAIRKALSLYPNNSQYRRFVSDLNIE